MYCAKELTRHMAETFSDTDCASCRRTRRSTTGGYTVAGSHLIKMWCKTQAVVAFISAEAELYGLSESVCRNNGTHIDVQRPRHAYEWSGTGDASAALAIVVRRLGKLRPLDTNYLWIQEKAAKDDLNFKKVAGIDNGADLFTKTLSWNEIQSHIHKLSSQFIPDEVNVNYVGARPNGVNLPQVLQELGIDRRQRLGSVDSNRHELSNKTYHCEIRTCME